VPILIYLGDIEMQRDFDDKTYKPRNKFVKVNNSNNLLVPLFSNTPPVPPYPLSLMSGRGYSNLITRIILRFRSHQAMSILKTSIELVTNILSIKLLTLVGLK